MESDLVADLDPNATLGGMDLELEISIGEIIDEIVNTSISQERDETLDQTIERLLTQVNYHYSFLKISHASSCLPVRYGCRRYLRSRSPVLPTQPGQGRAGGETSQGRGWAPGDDGSWCGKERKTKKKEK